VLCHPIPSFPIPKFRRHPISSPKSNHAPYSQRNSHRSHAPARPPPRSHTHSHTFIQRRIIPALHLVSHLLYFFNAMDMCRTDTTPSMPRSGVQPCRQAGNHVSPKNIRCSCRSLNKKVEPHKPEKRACLCVPLDSAITLHWVVFFGLWDAAGLTAAMYYVCRFVTVRVLHMRFLPPPPWRECNCGIWGDGFGSGLRDEGKKKCGEC
jgi:hypothetical protein